MCPVTECRMKRIFKPDMINKAIAESRYKDVLEDLPVRFFLVEYEEGEFLQAPEESQGLIQIVVEGALSIYFIRDDGSSYSLAISTKDDIIGEMEFFDRFENRGVYAEATRKLTCLALSTGEHREELMGNAEFLRVLAGSLARKMEQVTMQDAAQASLRERVCAYMVYKCDEGRLKGVEHAAFMLHCSPRQLQRILNEFVRDGVAVKTGKGTYELCI